MKHPGRGVRVLVANVLPVAAVIACVAWWTGAVDSAVVMTASILRGLAAFAAIIHDVIVALGVVALAGMLFDSVGSVFMIAPFKIDMAMIAALLTIIGYSLNDTIVLFDRVRENRGRLAVATSQIINDSINQVISRTVLTSLTTFLAVAMMYLFGGPGIHGFAFALVIGVVAGTYSSIAIASPLLMIGLKAAARRAEQKSEGDESPEPTTA